MYENLHERFNLAGARANLAEIARLRRRLDDAGADTLASLRLAREMGDKDEVRTRSATLPGDQLVIALGAELTG